MSAALLQLDVLLRTVVEVQLVAAGHHLNVHIHSVIHAGVGGAIVAAHRAGEIVHSALLGLVQTQLVGHALHGVGHHTQRAGGLIGGVGSIGLGIHRSIRLGIHGSAALTINGDGIQTHLTAAQHAGEGIHAVQNDGNHLIGRIGAGTDGCLQRRSIGSGITHKLNLGHAGILHNQSGILVETGRLSVVGHVAAGSILIISNDNAILLPYLAVGIKLGAFAHIIKGNGCRRRLGRHSEGDDAAQHQNRQQCGEHFAHFHRSFPPKRWCLVG